MRSPAEQAEVFALLRAASGGDPVQTHISAVFVGDGSVWKLRKAVRLSFVDFTTLAERRRTAERELELNAPHAPGLYRRVVAVTREADGTLALDGPGEPIDFVVEMAKVPACDFLDARAEAGLLDGQTLDAVADAVCDWHAAAPPDDRDGGAAIRAIADGNLSSARAAGLPEEEIGAWHAALTAALEARRAWMQARGESQKIRRVHGDLHLGNLCLWQGRPVAFDALEFDEALATVEVGYDLAFLLMDLQHRLGRAPANRVLARYVARTGDHALTAALAPFLSLRALIRAHVEATRGKPWRAYLDAARDALVPRPPLLVAIGGLPGTGKSTLARALALELGASPGALILRSDEIRKRRAGVPPEQRLPPDAYAEAESRHVLAALVDAARQTVAGGHAVVADATFMDSRDRAAIEAAAGAVPFVGLWLTAPREVLEARIASRRGDASDADLAVLRRAAASPNALPPASGVWITLDATESDALLDRVRAAVARAAPTLPGGGAPTRAGGEAPRGLC